MTETTRPDALNTLVRRVISLCSFLLVLFALRFIFSCADLLRPFLPFERLGFLFQLPLLGTIIREITNRYLSTCSNASIDLLILAGFTLVGLAIAANNVIPVTRSQSMSQGILFLFAQQFLGLKRPVVVGSEGAFQVRAAPTGRTRGPGLIHNDAFTALALEKGGKFVRVVGPGAGNLKKGEEVHSALDLRPQIMRRHIAAQTRDGVHLEMDLGLSVEIRRPSDWSGDDGCYAFEQEAVFEAVYAEPAGKGNANSDPRTRLGPAGWCSVITAVAADAARQLIARHTLDQLFTVSSLDDDPQGEINTELNNILTSELGRYGGHVVKAGITNLQAPTSVLHQRLEIRRKELERRLELTAHPEAT